MDEISSEDARRGEVVPLGCRRGGGGADCPFSRLARLKRNTKDLLSSKSIQIPLHVPRSSQPRPIISSALLLLVPISIIAFTLPHHAVFNPTIPSAFDDPLLNISSLDDESNSPTSGANAEQQSQPNFFVSKTGTNSRSTATSSAAGPNADTSQNNKGKVETNLGPPTSLVEMDPDLLRQMLGYAQPEEHHHRFEWSGNVGRTCRTFHRLSREDSEWNREVFLSLDDFVEYVSVGRTTSESDNPRDLSVALLRRLEVDASMRSRVKRLHVIYCRSDQLYAKDVLTSLKSLLSRPGSFPNLTCLAIFGDFLCHSTEDSKFELINSRLLLSLPAALPKLEFLWLDSCFATSCFGCTSTPTTASAGRNSCAMKEVSREQLIQFATRLKTSLRELHIDIAPWMSDDNIEALLSVLGESLHGLYFSNYNPHLFGRNNGDQSGPHRSTGFYPFTHRSLQAVAKHCSNLRHVSVTHREKNIPNSRSVINAWEESFKLVLGANKELSNSPTKHGVTYDEETWRNCVSLSAFVKRKD